MQLRGKLGAEASSFPDVVNARRPQPIDATEMTEERPPACLADAGKVVENGFADPS